ncbi:MAG: glycosyltransferase family 9 protein [Dysgonamonadaceae bacterium]|jgi:ADP-heptose:LPS heptosyltransferase|nr:glycosyltransferase family 9 protein [Dysgonamonadaceae bacterium]
MNLTIVIRLSALGDTAILLPALYSAARRYPGEQFVLVTKTQFAPIFINRPPNLQIEGIDVRGGHAGFRGLMRFIARLKKIAKGYEKIRIADMHGLPRSRAISLAFWLKGAKTAAIDKGRIDKWRLTRRRNKILKPLKTSLQRYCEVFAKIGLPTEITFDRLFPEKPKTDEIRIGIAPFARHPGKTWKPDKMEKLLQMLTKSGDKRIFLFGSGAEAPQLAAWSLKYAGVESLAGAGLSFPEELEIINSLSLLVGMDSGNMHLASLCGVPVVSIWGATHPFAGFYGFRQAKSNAVQTDLPCRPCSVFGNKPCFRGDYACLNTISPEKVLEKINEIL